MSITSGQKTNMMPIIHAISRKVSKPVSKVLTGKKVRTTRSNDDAGARCRATQNDADQVFLFHDVSRKIPRQQEKQLKRTFGTNGK